MDKNIIQKAREYAVLEIEKFKAPAMDHFKLSENKAIEIANNFNIDVDIVKIGGLFNGC